MKREFGGKLFNYILICVVCTCGLLTSVLKVEADGMLLPPPDSYVYETDQKAVIFYDKGIENLIISIEFKGDAEEFAWIVPTPSRPQVEKSTDKLFTRLDELTKPEDFYRPQRSFDAGMAGSMNKSEAPRVRVLETKKIDYYDIAILEANDKNALYDWLNNHGYIFPQSGKSIIDEYIQKSWNFTAVKIDTKKLGRATSRQLKEGHAIPLKLSFKTDQIVYPMKISSIIGEEDNAPEGEVTYVDGVDGGKGVKIDSDRVIATDEIVDGFNPDSGKIEIYLKKNNSNPLYTIIESKQYQEGTSKNYYRGFILENKSRNIFSLMLYTSQGQRQFNVDLGSDFKKGEWQKYSFDWGMKKALNKEIQMNFSIDGLSRKVTRVYSAKGPVGVVYDDEAKVVIGGNYFPKGKPSPQYRVSRKNDLIIDDVKISSFGKEVFSANFSNNLETETLNGGKISMRIFNTDNSGKINSFSPWMNSDSMGVLLYIFADKKMELTGFDMQYAGLINKESIKNLARIDGKTPWIEPSENKYYLTRLYKNMDIAEMTDDLYPQESDNSSSFNAVGNEKSRLIWAILLIVLSLSSLGAMTYVVVKKEREKGDK